MYKILVVDDEPRVSIGIRNFLLASDLSISSVETALNGFEAVDYLRMDQFDLVLTDIQMSRMSGIELMETIYMEQPNLPVIVISAHEKFDFAMKSLRLGARDYLVKPVDQEDLLRVVRGVLTEKEEIGKRALERSRLERNKRIPDSARRQEILMELVTERGLSKKEHEDLLAELGDKIKGPYFGVVTVRLDLSRGGFSHREVLQQDRKLLKFAALNLFSESLAEWGGLAFSGFGNELIGIIQVKAPAGTEPRGQLQTQLHLVGQYVSNNLRQYLNLEATIGTSSLRDDATLLAKLMEEANLAVNWKRLHPGQNVFYYADIAAQDSLNMVEWMAKVEACVQQLKKGGDELPEASARDLIAMLRRLGHTDELAHSYFGMLVYRIYGLLLEYGHAGTASLRRFDPDVYYKDLRIEARIGRLAAYMEDAARTIQMMARERETTILSRILAYIRQHYRNPALKIQDIAGEVHFSSAYLGYLFKRETKKNVWDYVTELRIQEAKHLLVTTDKKRYEIAYEVGYESPEHFSRMFKRYAGVSPADYRKEGQGGSR
ncbi:response regulator transcription factor [Paenibacillus methanolicus]|uniref:Two-component system response regulator YesN n=1 Tax=Paenibacillus methanolicus TaxID=582686 RepID=A0A5S5C1R9_9BACL|nr:response regulator [Paenibacillus methanolicus]TYP73247.1 two-component system response regulator YesN [Paenibacillus methanolicus]